MQKQKISPLKTQKYLRFIKSIIGQGGYPYPLKNIFSADLDELEHAKKVVKMSKFWDDPFLIQK